MESRPFLKTGRAMKKTHCKRGHEMTSANTYTQPRLGYTECVNCRKGRRLALREAKPLQKTPGLVTNRSFGVIGRFVLNYNFPKIKFCSKGHAIVGDNIAFSSREIRCRTCALKGALRNRENGRLAEDVIRNVLQGLRDGKTLSNLAGFRGDKYIGGKIVDTQRLSRFCDENPRMGKHIRSLAERNRINTLAENNRTKARGQPHLVTAIVRASNIMDVISAAVPRHLPRDLRDDAIQNIWLAIFEGRLKRSEIAARAHEFVRAEYKINHNAWGPR